MPKIFGRVFSLKAVKADLSNNSGDIREVL